jgi:hypothetical protein
MPKNHAPSAYRALVKESKSGSGRAPAELARAARALPDPYYASLALISISLDSRLTPPEASKLMEDSLSLADRESRPWRKAELLAEICRKGKGASFSSSLMGSVFGKIGKFTDGQALAGVISGCAAHLGCGHASGLLRLGLANEGHETESCKPVVKYWVENCDTAGKEIMAVLAGIPPSVVRVKLAGYLHTQLAKKGSDDIGILREAIDTALKLKGPERIDGLRYLASQSSDLQSLETVAAAAMSLDSPAETAALLATLAGGAHKAGHREMALEWFRAGVECIGSSEGAEGTLRNLAAGLKRLGEDEMADGIFSRLGKTAKTGKETPASAAPAKPRAGKPRHMLVLCDTHEGGLGPVHLRMVARAAPLCVAYGLDLGLLDFPETDLGVIVKKVLADTNVGKGGQYLKELHEEGRVVLFGNSRELEPAGLVVATTSHPATGKALSLGDAAKAAAKHPKKRLLVLMGLGRKGLPKSLMDAARHHAELTGANVPLETSTAMGIIAQQLGMLSIPKRY